MNLFWQTILRLTRDCLLISSFYFFIIFVVFYLSPQDLVRYRIFFLYLLITSSKTFHSSPYKEFRQSDECTHRRLMIVQTYIDFISALVSFIIYKFFSTSAFIKVTEICSQTFSL